MTNARRSYSDADQLSLTTQVDGHCPRCDDPLFYRKGNRKFKGYELAHIYPLNPSPEEVKDLAGLPLLHADVNDPNNLIPLCESCHGKFDKPRTADEYLELYDIKRAALERELQREIASSYPLESQIADIVARLHDVVLDDQHVSDLQFNVKRLDSKFDASLSGPTRRKIRNAVSDYFQYVRDAFNELEKSDSASSELILSQVRSFYLKQKKQGLAQNDVFSNVVNWIRKATGAKTLESAEIVAAFFVQNCEVFE